MECICTVYGILTLEIHPNNIIVLQGAFFNTKFIKGPITPIYKIQKSNLSIYSLWKSNERTLVSECTILVLNVWSSHHSIDGSRKRSAEASWCAYWGSKQGKGPWLLAFVTGDLGQETPNI